MRSSHGEHSSFTRGTFLINSSPILRWKTLGNIFSQSSFENVIYKMATNMFMTYCVKLRQNSGHWHRDLYLIPSTYLVFFPQKTQPVYPKLRFAIYGVITACVQNTHYQAVTFIILYGHPSAIVKRAVPPTHNPDNNYSYSYPQNPACHVGVLSWKGLPH